MIIVICSLTVLCLLLNFLMLDITHGITACEPEWFGTNCQYKCLCTGSSCDSVGQCIAGSKCKPGYFGPACQYGDIVQLTSLTSGAPMWLRDGDDATCNSDPRLQSVALRFHKGLSFSWLRIGVSSSDALNRFDIKLNEGVSCPNMKNTTDGDTSMDVYCSVDMAVRSLTLSGPGVPFLCSVYISLGRNVASRASTSHPFINVHADLHAALLPNKIHQDKSEHGCRHIVSKTDKAESSWNHSFRTPQSVTAFLWTKRSEDISSGIHLRMYGTGGQLVNYFVADDDDYYIHIQRPEAVSLVSISAWTNQLLNLCELFIFGETLCPESTFGLDCGSLCNCTDKRETCLVSTGKCATSCPDGFYGWRCSVPCPDTCRSGICTPRYGDCIREPRPASVLKRLVRTKLPNNITDLPPTGCIPGYYGKGCATRCAAKCDHKCDPITGACLKCLAGFHGENCTEICDILCFNHLCDADSGYCLECPVDRYGNFCEQLCGEHCYLRECNTTTGKCFSCAAGYKGPDCTKVPWNVTLFIVLLFLIPSVIACFFCCEVLSDEDAEDQDKNSMSTELSVQPSTSAL